MTDLPGRTTKQADENSAELDRLLQHYDEAQCLPASISREFLSAAVMHMIAKKVEFGVVYTDTKIYIGYYGGNDQHVPHLWSDKKWRIGPDPDEIDKNLWNDFS